jgi:hypothetical protein
MSRTLSLSDRLTSACSELGGLLAQLEAEIVHKRREGFTAGGSPSRGGHRPLAAWNTPVAMLLFTVHAGLRELEADLNYAIAGHIRIRGGGDGVTIKLLTVIPSLTAGAGEQHQQRVARQIEAWCGQARMVLGEAERWQRLPRQPGEAEPRCPWCRKHTLRYKSFTGVVRCINPDPECKDADGNKPLGRLEIGIVSGEPQLAWNDKSTGVAI